MNNRTLQLLIVLTIAAIAFLLALNLAPHFMNPSSAKNESSLHIESREVKGASVVYKDKTYTLNMSQQNDLIEWINAAIPVGSDAINPEPLLDSGQFEIYFFENKSALILKPVGVVNSNLVFRVPKWNKEGWIKDVSDGKLLYLLKNSHADIP